MQRLLAIFLSSLQPMDLNRSFIRPVVLFTLSLWVFGLSLSAQDIRGVVLDAETGEPLFSATVIEKGTTNGVITDFDGEFTIKVSKLPATLVLQYIGYTPQEIRVEDASKKLSLKMVVVDTDLGPVEVIADRITEKQKQSPLTVESMDLIAIKECPTGNFYESLGSLKGVDMTTASLGFRVINTRGFNSTSPVRSLQLIDGVDNQSPGLNFSLGNFLGACDLDVKSVDIVAGASSAYFGPGAFNGVINMETKNPFIYNGLMASLKIGERNLFEPSVRIADVFQNKNQLDYLAYKINVFYLRAHDWEANNFEPINGSPNDENNPGRFDAVNVYGDEYFPANDFSDVEPWNYEGLGTYYRTGYKEEDLVDYNTSNFKACGAVHLRLKPALGFESPELIWATNVGEGTTVYQGDNRFRLDGIFFIQNRVELRKKDKYFLRIYSTHEDAGNSYDPYATALQLLDSARTDEYWALVYRKYWTDSIIPIIENSGYPDLTWSIDSSGALVSSFDYDALNAWLIEYQDSLSYWHTLVEQWTNGGNGNIVGAGENGYFAPGSTQFNSMFDLLTKSKNNDVERGTRFYDKSALYHAQGELKLNNEGRIKYTTGFSTRMYRPRSDGTIFSDTAGTRITNYEAGVYAGATRKFSEDRWVTSATVRLDKNQNFNLIFTPAASLVFSPRKNHYLRFSASTALRNPTLTDQYLLLDIGPAILSGNLEGVDSLITIESFGDFRNTLDPDTIRYFNIDPIRPERAVTIELGYRFTVGKNLFADLNGYFTSYSDFIGYNIGLETTFDKFTGLPGEITVYRYSANSQGNVQTTGAGLALNYYIGKHLMASGNYNWNSLIKSDENDPIIPAFNTPEHKFNLALSGRDYKLLKKKDHTFGFSANFKWIDRFMFEGSPQFTGEVPSYSLLDLQMNYTVPAINTNFKLGCSNALDNMAIQTYGGPRIGRLAYFSVLYELADF